VCCVQGRVVIHSSTALQVGVILPKTPAEPTHRRRPDVRQVGGREGVGGEVETPPRGAAARPHEHPQPSCIFASCTKRSDGRSSTFLSRRALVTGIVYSGVGWMCVLCNASVDFPCSPLLHFQRSSPLNYSNAGLLGRAPPRGTPSGRLQTRGTVSRDPGQNAALDGATPHVGIGYLTRHKGVG
jgi:hypothetical protein